VNRRSALGFWLAAASVALAVGLLLAALLYLQMPFPIWELLRPPPELPEGPAEWRMLWFSLGIGALLAVGLIVGAKRLRDRAS
jgi:hypothetical protein